MKKLIIFLSLLLSQLNIAFCLYGQYLIITDIHYDRHYIVGSDPSQYCHRGTGDAGYFAVQGNDCDIGYNLVNQTFVWWQSWLKNNSNSIDFVLWLGDNGEHNQDPELQRTEDDIFAENQIISNFMNSTFFAQGIPVLPAIGNNEFNPHDYYYYLRFPPEPNNKWLVGLNDIWNQYLTIEQQEMFLEGGYYYAQIQSDLYIIVLNTNLVMKSNDLIKSCDHSKSAGYTQMVWFTGILDKIYKENSKVIVTGHMAPISKYWHSKCIKSYNQITEQYQDIIIAHQFGHLHADAFTLINQFQNNNYNFLSNSANNEEKLLSESNSKCASGVINIIPSVEPTYNPTSRIVKYHPQYPYNLIQYTQYYQNITLANQLKTFTYEIEYIFPQAYGYDTYDIETYCSIYKKVEATKANPTQALYDYYLYVSEIPKP